MSSFTSFRKLNTKSYQKSNAILTADDIYWKKLGVPVLLKEFGPIDYIDFSPIEPYYFAVTCSVRVQIYNPITKLVVKNLSRFRENAYGAVFRSDGKLLCAGGEESNVKLFDVASKSLLRLFKGHSAAVHRTYFIPDKPQIVSFSDDKTVKLWDIATEKDIITYSEHTDYIRAGAVSPILPEIFLSGGYDSIVKMYDARSEKVILNVNHGSPIESLLFLPSGGIFLSAGSTDIKIWDTLAGGKLLGSISQHHKTITCLRLASDNKRILSAGLDRHVKIYDVSTFQVVHSLDYPNAILSLDISKNDGTIAAGLVDGLVSVRRREDEQKETKTNKNSASFKYVSNTHLESIDTTVPTLKTGSEAKYDRCLRMFQYSKALDCVLLPYVCNKHPEVTVSVMKELIRRKALDRAFQGRETKSLLQILRFFIRNLTDYRFTRVLIDAVNVFVDVYEKNLDSLPNEVNQAFINLSKLLNDEVKLSIQMAELQGVMHMLLSGANAPNESVKTSTLQNLTPSADAQKNLIVNIS